MRIELELLEQVFTVPHEGKMVNMNQIVYGKNDMYANQTYLDMNMFKLSSKIFSTFFNV